MTPEERIAQGLHDAEARAVFSFWRAEVGRLPRGHEQRVREMTRRFGLARMQRSVIALRDSGLRRTADRWSFFLALFGEAP